MNEFSLKDELDADIKRADSSQRKKRRVIGCVLSLACLSIVITPLVLQRSTEKENEADHQSPTTHHSNPEEAAQQESDHATPRNTSQPQIGASQNTTASPQPSYTPPAPSPINKAEFQALGHRTGANYANIVELVTFPSGMSNDDKLIRVKQAYALDKQHFSEVTGLRGMVNMAANTPPEYMAAVELAESGVSNISVGVDGLNRYFTNPNSVSSLEVSTGSIEKGARELLQFSEKLNGL